VVITCTNYQDEEISIGSQYGGWQHYHQEVPLWIVHSGRQNRRTLFLRGRPDNCMIDSYFTQRDRRVLGITCWRPYDWAATRAWWQKGPPFLVEHRLNLGPAKDYNLVRIDGQPFKDEAAIVENGVLLAEKPGLRIALRLMVPPMGARRTPACLTVDPSGDLLVIVEYASSPSVDGFLKLTASACGWLVRVFSPGLASSREIESEFLRASIETSQPKPGSWKLRLTDGMELIAPVTPEARQQYEAEHRPPVGALVAHPLFSLSSTDSARRWLHVED
jgi:hypothetical protein